MPKLVRDMRNFDEENFLDDLHCNLLDLNLSENNTNILFQSFQDTFTRVVEKHAPLREQNGSEKKKLRTPWITNGIITSIKKKSSLRLIAISARSQEKTTAYNRYRNMTNRIIVKAKAKYYSEKLAAAMNTSRTTWAIINEVIGKKKE